MVIKSDTTIDVNISFHKTYIIGIGIIIYCLYGGDVNLWTIMSTLETTYV